MPPSPSPPPPQQQQQQDPDPNQTSTGNGKSYVQGHSRYTTATHESRTAASNAAFLLPFIKPTDHILDVGCGPGTITAGLARCASEGRTVGVDVSEEVLSKARDLAAAATGAAAAAAADEGIPGELVFEQADVLAGLPYPTGTFDVVYASQLLGHFTRPGEALRALREMRRVLKPGGVLAARHAVAQHFFPRELGLDELWVGNLHRALGRGVAEEKEGVVEHPGPKMPALLRGAGFEVDDPGGKVRIGCGSSVVWRAEERVWLRWRAEGQLGEGDAFRRSWLEAGIGVEEIERTLEAVRAWAGMEDAWFVSLQSEVLAWK